MRTSSIKSLVSTLAMVATLTLAVPIAEARSAQPRESRAGRGDTVVRAVLNLLKRIGRVAATGGPSIPQGPTTGSGNDTSTGTETGTTSTGETGQ